MRCLSMRTILLLLVGCALSLGIARANSYTVYFSDFYSGNSIVGTGTFSFNGTYGDGAYLLSSLTNYNIDFTIYGDTSPIAILRQSIWHMWKSSSTPEGPTSTSIQTASSAAIVMVPMADLWISRMRPTRITRRASSPITPRLLH